MVMVKQVHQMSWGFYHDVFEPHHEKTRFLPVQKQRCRSAVQLISAFVFATWLVQFLFYLDPKSQASSLFSVPVQADQCRTWSETMKTSFLVSRLIYK